jgi:hypothetical protein
MIRSLEDFELLVTALAMQCRGTLKTEDLYARYQELMSEGGEEALIGLWNDLEPIPMALDWSDLPFSPEESMRKRALILGSQVVEQFDGEYPQNVDFKMDEGFQHLVMHGKLGLMSLLFGLQEKDPQLKISKCAAMIERFMEHIESLVEQLIFSKDWSSFAIAMGIEAFDDQSERREWLKGRLQPFALMRSLYLEEPSSGMSPLEWWVSQERYIPNLPKC